MCRTTLIAVLICIIANPLNACLNDSATQVDEQQFVSGYGKQSGSHRKEFSLVPLLFILPSIALISLGFIWMRQEKKLAALKQQQFYNKNIV